MITENPRPENEIGTAEHAALVTAGRHPGVVHAMAWLAFSHLPANIQAYSRPFYEAALGLLSVVPTDSAELTTALNKLKEAKDEAVRAGVLAETGRPGPAPRPGVIVDPPQFGNFGAGASRPRPIRDWPQA